MQGAYYLQKVNELFDELCARITMKGNNERVRFLENLRGWTHMMINY